MDIKEIEKFIPILIQLSFALAVAVGGIVLSLVFGKAGKANKAKGKAYECGKPELGVSGSRFSVKFYLVAMIFILFDIEVIFMYPWALSFRELVSTSLNTLWAMVAFVGIVEIGHLYAYKKGVFEWNVRNS